MEIRIDFNKMDKANSSNEPFDMDKMNEELTDTIKPRKRKPGEENVELSDYSDSSIDSTDMSSRIHIKPDLLLHLNTIITESELKRRQSIKRRRVEKVPDVIVDESMYDVNNSSTDNVIVNYTHETGIYHPIDAIKLIRKKENVAVGSWLLVSSVREGWNYERVKSFLMKKYQIRSVMSKSETQGLETSKDDKFFQAVIKFKSDAELNRVFNDLIRRKIHRKFIFFTFVDMPDIYYDSDSDDDKSSQRRFYLKHEEKI